MSVVKKSDIIITVGLDAKNVPVSMEWSATDAANGGEKQDCKAMLLALFDGNSRETMRIDLWTADFQVEEMDRFMYQTLRSLGDTYHKATKNTELANMMQNFVQYFGEKTEVIQKPKK
jgi:gliding motility-associated protein GldC